MNRVYNAMNKRLLVFGIERAIFTGAVFSAVAVFYLAGTIIGAFLLFAAIYTLARRMARVDAKWHEISFARLRQERLYDSAER